MIKYLCSDCGKDFESKNNAVERICPYCNSDSKSHEMMSFTEPDDVLHHEMEQSEWDA